MKSVSVSRSSSRCSLTMPSANTMPNWCRSSRARASPRSLKSACSLKAYRKAAQKWHPDNFQEGDEKKKAEKKFIDIAAAKEVLTDEEKRRQFDAGEDPLDPEGNRGQGGFHPHHHQFFQHGSPFQFKFHFN